MSASAKKGWAGAAAKLVATQFNEGLKNNQTKPNPRKKFKTPNGSKAANNLAPPSADDHLELMGRKSYQNIFSEISGDSANGKVDGGTLSGLAALAGAPSELESAGAGGRRPSSQRLAALLEATSYRDGAPPQQTQQRGHRGPGPISMSATLQAKSAEILGQAPASAGVGAVLATSLTSSPFTPGTADSPLSAATDVSVTPTSASAAQEVMVTPGGKVVDSRTANRLEKNKLAARECRRKKKMYVKDLEVKVQNLEAKNAELLQQLEKFKQILKPEELARIESAAANTAAVTALAEGGGGAEAT